MASNNAMIRIIGCCYKLSYWDEVWMKHASCQGIGNIWVGTYTEWVRSLQANSIVEDTYTNKEDQLSCPRQLLQKNKQHETG